LLAAIAIIADNQSQEVEGIIDSGPSTVQIMLRFLRNLTRLGFFRGFRSVRKVILFVRKNAANLLLNWF